MSYQSDITLKDVRGSLRSRKTESIGNLIQLLQKKGRLPTSIEELRQRFDKILNDPGLPQHKREQELHALMLELDMNQRQFNDMQKRSALERAAEFYDALKQEPVKAAEWYLTPSRTEVRVSDSTLTISFPNDFVKDRVKDHRELFAAINASARAVGCDRVFLEVDEQLRKNLEAEIAAEEKFQAAVPKQPSSSHQKKDLVSMCRQLHGELEVNCSLPLSRDRDRWDRLIVGRCNRAAHATVQIAIDYFYGNQPIDKTIFIYGESATGKTALLQGAVWVIQNKVQEALEEILKLDPAKPEDSKRIMPLKKRARFKARYTTALHFSNEYGRLVGSKKMYPREFLESYMNLDLFIIDDIQAITQTDAKKSKMRLNELIDHLTNAGKIVIIASDTPYSKLKAGLPDRLFTRIGQGARISLEYPSDDVKKQAFLDALKDHEIGIDAAIMPHIDAILNSDRVVNFRDAIALAATYRMQITAEETPLQAIAYIRDMFEITTTKSSAEASLAVFREAAKSAGQQDITQLFNEGLRKYDGISGQQDIARMKSLADEAKDVAIYIAYRLAHQELGSKANVNVKKWCGYDSTSPINRVRDIFDRDMAALGYEITDDMVDIRKPAQYIFNQVYGQYRKFKHAQEEAARMPLFDQDKEIQKNGRPKF